MHPMLNIAVRAARSGGNVIAGISFFITGAEPSGFTIDNLTFGSAAEVNLASVGVGILVENNASPTILNNVVAGLDQGISVDGTSQTNQGFTAVLTPAAITTRGRKNAF